MRAYFLEAIACAIEIGAFPKDAKLIEKELDELKNFQTSEGSFTTFGSYPESSSVYFQTAYALIPFIKMKNLKFLTKNYDIVIEKGLKFIRHEYYEMNRDREANSIAAIAFGQAENSCAFKNINQFQKCCKLSINQDECDLRITSYAAIVHLKTKDFKTAMTLMSYIFEQYNLLKNRQKSHSIAIATEAISTFLIARKNFLSTNLTISFENEHNFKEIFHITDNNQKEISMVRFPKLSRETLIRVEGTGFLLAKIVFEHNIEINGERDKSLGLNLKTSKGLKDFEKSLQICVMYQPKVITNDTIKTLKYVMTDVEFPNGYVFMELKKVQSITSNINWLVSSHKNIQRSLVTSFSNFHLFLYFLVF